MSDKYAREKAVARKWAESAWKRLELETPVNLHIVCDYLGIEMERVVLPNDLLGLYLRNGEGKGFIKLNQGLSEQRLRFTWAHEIGHHLALKGAGEVYAEARADAQGGDEYEHICNRFAAELLMPKAKVREAAEELGHPATDKSRTIAARFGVSVRAMRLRLVELDLDTR